MRIYLARKEMDAARVAFQKAEEALAKTYCPYRRDAYLIVHRPPARFQLCWFRSHWRILSGA